MKKIVLTGVLMAVAAAAFAIDFSVEARTDLFYTSYIRNSAFDKMGALQADLKGLDTPLTVTAVDAFEKIRLKANAEAEPVKLNFDARIYLGVKTPVFDFVIDNAYLTYENGPFVLYAGKQRMKWGTGYFWNPTDNLQRAKDIFRTTEDLEGILALRAEYSNDYLTPSLIFIPDLSGDFTDLMDNFKIAVQFYKLIGTMDFYLNFVSSWFESTSGAAISWDNGLFVLNAEACRKTPPAAMWDMADWGNGKVLDFVIGASKTMGDFFINVEYYRKNTGITNGEYVLDVISRGYGAAMSKQDYIAYSASYTWDQKLAFSLTGMHGLDDGTSYLFPSISYIENQSFDVQLSLLKNFTEEGINEGNYSTPVSSAVELRINAYF